MNCPKCSAELPEGSTSCNTCGWVGEEKTATEEVKEEVSVDILADQIDVDFNDLENFEAPEEDADIKLEDMVVDFDQINENAKPVQKKQHMWPAVVTSFLAGVLATLITIGCFNGMIMNTFDKWTQGVPEDVIKGYFYAFYNTKDTTKLVKTMSPYMRAQLLSSLQNYNYVDSDKDIDVTDDKAFKDVMDTYFKVVESQSSYTTHPVIDSINIKNALYYKSNSDEYTTLINSYKEYADTDKISLFAKVTFELSYHVEDNANVAEQITTVAPGTTSKEKNTTTTKATTTTTTTKKVESTSSEKYNQEWTANCVKIDGTWYIYDSSQTSES